MAQCGAAVFINRPTYLLYHLLECCLHCQLVIWARFRQQRALAAVFGFSLDAGDRQSLGTGSAVVFECAVLFI